MDKTNYRQTEYNKPFIIQRADPYVYRHSDGTICLKKGAGLEEFFLPQALNLKGCTSSG